MLTLPSPRKETATLERANESLPARIRWRTMKLLFRGLGFRAFHNLAESIEPSRDLIDTATESVHIVCRDDDADELLTEPLLDRLTTKAEDNPELEVVFVCGPNPINNTKKALERHPLSQLKNVEVHGISNEPSPLFWVVDGVNVRIEQPHNNPQGERRGRISYNTRHLAATLERKFQQLRQQADTEAHKAE